MLTALLLLTSCGVARAQPTVIEPFALHDSRGALHSLEDWSASPAVVVVFLGTECPLAKLYAERLVDLQRRYRERGVVFVGVNSNDQDTLREIGRYVTQHGIDFPVLKDPDQRAADLFGAVRTPAAYLLDSKRRVRYRGRIDDQYGVGSSRPEPTVHYLADAIDQLLAGEPIATPETAAIGCVIGRASRHAPTGDITFAKHVSRVLNQHCVRCHRAGQIAPFELSTYDDAVAWSATMLETVNEGRMPPWHANPAHGEFVNDTHMPAADKQTLTRWVENGMPEGDPADLPEPPEYPSEWRIGEPDLVLAMPESFDVPAKGVVDYQYFEAHEPFEKDVWVKASEIRPGNPSVVHHAFVYYLPPGQDDPHDEDPLINAIAGFAPGMPATLWPEGHARLIPAGSRLFFQMHYTPTGSPQTDQTEVGLVLADPSERLKEIRFGIAVNTDLRIPPHAADHVVHAGYGFTQDTLVHALIPHMHFRGKAFRFTAHYPDGKKEVLLDVPRYDFNWQNAYELVEPKLMPEGAELICRGVFDNSADNPANPDPSKEVRWGDQSWDEMMLGSFVTSQPDWIGPGEYPKVTPAGDGRFTVEFRYKPTHQKANTVAVAGSFNGWSADKNPLAGPDDEGYYRGSLELDRGVYEYKLVVDGDRWIYDPENPDRVGPFTNSGLRVAPATERSVSR
ncbi:redoxin domain-containing protein [Pseudobythopirellula maris]|uniref:redoxin domain-containing protein n=1 Tax=Pseudobythopirellula maris TaxID=2527991 RepID=UPI0018D2D7BD|nr:redoxin domain-containing protein [Pseudobythopirellula maris]